ncbi:hypothetical protein IWX50DRAFT_624301 [Phyllosticta citricarpa]
MMGLVLVWCWFSTWNSMHGQMDGRTKRRSTGVCLLVYFLLRFLRQIPLCRPPQFIGTDGLADWACTVRFGTVRFGSVRFGSYGVSNEWQTKSILDLPAELVFSVKLTD